MISILRALRSTLGSISPAFIAARIRPSKNFPYARNLSLTLVHISSGDWPIEREPPRARSRSPRAGTSDERAAQQSADRAESPLAASPRQPHAHVRTTDARLPEEPPRSTPRVIRSDSRGFQTEFQPAARFQTAACRYSRVAPALLQQHRGFAFASARRGNSSADVSIANNRPNDLLFLFYPILTRIRFKRQSKPTGCSVKILISLRIPAVSSTLISGNRGRLATGRSLGRPAQRKTAAVFGFRVCPA